MRFGADFEAAKLDARQVWKPLRSTTLAVGAVEVNHNQSYRLWEPLPAVVCDWEICAIFESYH